MKIYVISTLWPMMAAPLALLLLLGSPSSPARSATRTAAATQDAPRVFSLDPSELATAKARIKAGDPALRPALDQLVQDAQGALDLPPQSVTDKTVVAPSGDRHDYKSLGPYWWPNPKTPNGLPYIRRDGERNPESRNSAATDDARLGRTTGAAQTLSLAYYLTGNEEYAKHAALLLREWFLDPATRMNPNLTFGQAIPGIVSGRGTGIIETVNLTRIVDSEGLLGGSSNWTQQDQAGMTDWMKQYLNWLLTSSNGRDESKAANNHGSWYDVQVASLALFTGETDLARKVLETAKTKRIASEIRPDGSEPLELARTKSLGYSQFNTSALETLATLGDRVGVDLWDYRTKDGRSIHKAVNYLGPYADPNKKWPYQQIVPEDRIGLLAILQRAYLHYHDPQESAWIAEFPAGSIASDRTWLEYPGEK